MKRIIFMVTVASVAALMLALAGPAFATIHPLANSECASDSSQGVANAQEPPGLTPGGPDQSQATVAQPVIAVSGGDPFASPPPPAFKTFGPEFEDLEADYCPVDK
jgi:hypothetical protein